MSSSALRKDDAARSRKTGASQKEIDALHARPPFPDATGVTEHTHIRVSRSGLEWPRKLFHSSIAFLAIALWVFHTPVLPLVKFLAFGFVSCVIADVIRFNSKSFANLYETYLGFLMRMSEKDKINGVVWYLLGVIICLCIFPRDIATLSIMILSWCDSAASIFGRLFGRYTPPLPFRGTLFAPRKSVAGSLAAVLTGAFAGYLFYQYLAPLGAEGDLSWYPDSLLEGHGKWASTAAKAQVRSWLAKMPSHAGDGSQAWFLKYRLPNPQSRIGLGKLCAITGISAGLAEAIEVYGLDDNLTLAPIAGLLIWGSLMVSKSL